MRADDIMTTPARTCRAQETLNIAAHKMWEQDCGAIAVVNDEGKLVGMITDRDICMAGLMQNQPLGDIPVHIAMSRQVYAVEQDQSIEDVERLMAVHQVRRIPVVNTEGKPVGMVSINDLAREAARPQSRMRGGLPRLVQTLAVICEPRGTEQTAA
ncbi:MAG TPA: CBS domain-containing protein [Kofleriaceae bacterium]|nr:CBS domain-containing protein [Kofleriaceae bacterium]